MDIFNSLVWLWIAIAAVIFLVLVIFKIKIPYGRHSSNKWGKMIDNRLGWFLMELPALILFPLLSIMGPTNKNLLLWLLIGLWLVHYSYRVFIFPLKIRTNNKKMPLVIVLSGLSFNVINGIFNGYYIGYQATAGTTLLTANLVIGLVMFVTGIYINRASDLKLIELRKNNTGYQIPQGNLFKYISCPNHFGEIIEWSGFAVMAWNLPALSFAIWTLCNLIPRSLNHHIWYHENFKDYPKNRKAVIPFVL